MEMKRHLVNLKQYRKVSGKWQFLPAPRRQGHPRPHLFVVNGAPVSSKGRAFCLPLSPTPSASSCLRQIR